MAKLSDSLRGFGNLPLFRQLWLLVAVAASIAVGFSLVTWLQQPNYRALYSNIGLENSSEVVDALQQAGIKYKFDAENGTVYVPDENYAEAKIKLAAAGLPKNASVGFDWLNKNNNFGTSRFMEDARYTHALEGELAKTITTIKGITNARVHLAIPKQAVFLTDEGRPTASVLVKLAGGYALTEGQVNAIVQLVAASIPDLHPKDVSVADENGNLLTSTVNSSLERTEKEFSYVRQVQQDYENRILSILTPLVGENKVRARVAINMDFTQHEETKEHFDPKQQVIRSEQSLNEQKALPQGGGGVPGASANGGGEGGSSSNGTSSRNQSTKNYEVGKTITYVRDPVGTITRLTIAIVVDDRTKIDEKTGAKSTVKLTPDEIKRMTELVKLAVDFDTKRGDQISIVNSPFVPPPTFEALPTPKFWEQAWFMDLLRKIGGGLFGFVLALVLIRPLLKHLASRANLVHNVADQSMMAKQMELNNTADMIKMQQQQIDSIKNMASADPTRVAQVLKNWLGDSK